MSIINYIKMPQPLLVLGFFYAIFAIILLISYLKSGYWHGMLNRLKTLLSRNILYFVGFILFILFLIFVVDKPVTQLCQEYYNQNLYTLLDFICSMGEGWFIGGVLITLMLILDFLGKTKLAFVMRISLMASLFGGLTNSIIKFIFNRQRPSIGLEPLNFFHFFMSGDRHFVDLTYAYNSMSSGHTITAFAAILPLILYSKRKVTKCLWLTFGIAVACARVYTINHWLSDVCVAIVLGSIIGYACFMQNVYRIK